MPASLISEEEAELPSDSLVGDFTMVEYEIEGVSTLKVYQNYKNALKTLGAELVFDCKLDECGSEGMVIDLANAMRDSGHVGNYYRKPYFIRARLDSAQGNVHVGLFVGGFSGDVRVNQVIVEEVPVDDELISVSKEYLARETEKSSAVDRRTPEQKQEDHPMMARYPGARLSKVRRVEYEAIELPLSAVNPDSSLTESLTLTGDLYQHTYEAESVSTLKTYKNYLQAIESLGFSLIYSCELEECGNKSAASDLGERIAVTQQVSNFYRQPYYFVATRVTDQGRVIVAMYFGGFDGDVWIQQAIVEEKGTKTDLIDVDADKLYKEIQQSGKALVYGIYFDTGSALVKPQSADALKAISDLLQTHPDLDLYVVGHTDDTGESDYNLGLSSQRAASVVDVLKDEYSIDSGRLKPAGVGPYAPEAGNESDDGRRLNRRVELVRRL
jgi:outer membrane protein OmpA-like peptidoglycan-associated protein